MKKLLLASCLAVAGMFAFSSVEARADHRHHGHRHHGHHHGHWHGHWHTPAYHYAPRYVYRPPVYGVYPAYPAPVYRSYVYQPYPSTSLFIGGRNFAFGLSGF